MEATRPIDKFDEMFGCVCLRWATKDDIDRTIPTMVPRGHSVLVSIGEWFGIVPFAYTQGSIHVNRATFSIQCFTPELPWSPHLLYINRFYSRKGV